MQRSISGIIILTVFVHGDVSFSAEDSRETPPNIVFVFSDDHACSTISAYGGDEVHSTPQDTRLEATIGEQRRVLDLPATGDYGNFALFTSGHAFALKAGDYFVTLKPVAQNWTACNVTRPVLLFQ